MFEVWGYRGTRKPRNHEEARRPRNQETKGAEDWVDQEIMRPPEGRRSSNRERNQESKGTGDLDIGRKG